MDEADLNFWEKVWNFFADKGVTGICLGASLAFNAVQAKMNWEFVQFLKKFLGKDNATKS